MQFPESWLRSYCNPPLSTQQLADALTMAGLEVEDISTTGLPFTGVVVAEILETQQHPDADRLKVCLVNVGEAQPLTIVCGAPNAKAGMRVPCARVGAVLPAQGAAPALNIRVGKLRGVESQGMLCSAKELGLVDGVDGLLVLDADAPVGTDIRVHLNLDDALLTLKLTPNLAHCLSVHGVARELSAITGAPLQRPAVPTVSVAHTDTLPVQVDAPDLCGRFSGRIIKNIDPKAPTPRWMVDRLAQCGQRSVSALVDISNYVMFDLGQPTHIFDLGQLHGGLTVRWARPGETLELLNGNTVTLDETVGIIADERQVESLAGIMGGNATAVSDDTRTVYVEAAFWWPSAVAGRSRRFNFSTDAGHRFERGVDPQLTVPTIDHITSLILSVCGGQAGPITDQQPCMPKPLSVTLRVDRAQRVIGMPVSQSTCADALRGLGLAVVEGDGVLTVTPPSYRFDLQIEEDLIEEVVRVVGYDHLPSTPPLAPVVVTPKPERFRSPFAVRRLLASMGYQETINFSFVDEAWEVQLAANAEPIRVVNPIASHMGVMRSSLLASLLAVAKFNVDRKAERVCVFELGRVFLRDASVKSADTTVAGFNQPMRVAGLAMGPSKPLDWGGKRSAFDFFDAKGHVEALLAPRRATYQTCVHPSFHPGRCAQVVLDGKVIGHVGELHPQWAQLFDLTQAPVLFELELDAVLDQGVPEFVPFSKHQMVERDIAVWVSEAVTHDQVMAAIHAAPHNGVLKKATLFDIYRSKSEPATASTEKSLAVRLFLQGEGASFTDQQIDAAVASIVSTLSEQTGARMRA